MNKRRQALRAQNQKIAKAKLKKAQPGNGEFLASVPGKIASNREAIGNIMTTDYGLKNPFVRPNPLEVNSPILNMGSLVKPSMPIIDPAVISSSSAQSVEKPPVKPQRNPTIGLNFSNTPNAGMHGGVSFNTNKGGKGISIVTDTDFKAPGNLLEKSQVTVRGNRIPVAATIKGDGSVNVGLEGNLNDMVQNIFGGRGKNRGGKKTKTPKKNKN